jgi:hypothetical protein
VDPLEAEMADPTGLEVSSCSCAPWLTLVLVTVRCRHGHEAAGLLPRGTRRSEWRSLIGHLRGRHEAEHGCGCAGGTR